MLEVANLTIRYGPFLAVDDLAMNVGAGEIVGIVGPNGAGKSSVVKAIGGLVAPKTGAITFDGQDLLAVPPYQRITRGLSIVPEGRGLFPRMSVEENLVIGADAIGDRARRDRNLDRCFELFPILKERRWQAVGTLSGGQQQMVAVSVGLMADPRLLILDEPSLGLAPIVIGEIGRALRRLREEGLTVALFEQNAKLTCSVADRIYILATGAVRYHDNAETLLQNPEILDHLM
ncbi:ABC transporter ATP-binding protein [Chelatococcus asaccharovorans]|uniref:Branched-chain amino acid transport system ATP-binding protein n=1 Tax=Chelatococcus asaccharovorans TaxID=28210 RepID=A0A2V3UDJ6_9HYPH|nr:ABC transporter ATP-binding protein [Chelatococcus asaccharovorans]MBS7707164.1 ABC transporter ATP-binding protein [Chelatococcus asaccharovorans]PXW63346.1 branched-chain amino acid transport system ATP-binding protein [Chelatococcus asaccharovorans]CAH1652195.1 High-affinity branched-chain amino acid transport ATP-binding protein BraG [Chelatococcus asaccharovorans]CAH1693381.1 High-affinity branched-chain amino acid transport ATP-binding protein BraG [Chelatococcus asaccharovorans]